MRLNSTNFIVPLLIFGLVLLSAQNIPASQTFNPVQNLDKYSTEVSVQKEHYQHEFDTPPKIIGGFQALQDKIIYPEEAKQQNIEGKVVVEIFVNARGEVTDASVVKGIEKGGLNTAALRAVRKISFSPALQDEKPIAVRVQLPIQFKLDSSSDNG